MTPGLLGYKYHFLHLKWSVLPTLSLHHLSFFCESPTPFQKQASTWASLPRHCLSLKSVAAVVYERPVSSGQAGFFWEKLQNLLNCKSMWPFYSPLKITEKSLQSSGQTQNSSGKGWGGSGGWKRLSVSDPFCHYHNRTLLRLVVRIRRNNAGQQLNSN